MDFKAEWAVCYIRVGCDAESGSVQDSRVIDVEKKLVVIAIIKFDRKKHELPGTELAWRRYKMDSLMTMLREVRCIRDLRSVSLAGWVDLAAPQIPSSHLFPNIIFICFLPLSINTFPSSQQTGEFNINHSFSQRYPNTKSYYWLDITLKPPNLLFSTSRCFISYSGASRYICNLLTSKASRLMIKSSHYPVRR